MPNKINVMEKCKTLNCDNEPYGSTEFCVLHCSKNGYQQDRESMLLNKFYDSLVKHISKLLLEQHHANRNFGQSDVELALTNKGDNSNNAVFIRHKLEQTEFVLTEIIFPARDNRDYFDYAAILDRVGGIWFKQCSFNTPILELKKVKVFFDECTFLEEWHLFNHKLLENSINVLYQNCLFKKYVTASSVEQGNIVLNGVIFSDCNFCDELIIENVEIQPILFANTGYKQFQIEKLQLMNSTFFEHFCLEDHEIRNVEISKVQFNKNFEFKNNRVKSFIINNSVCNNLANFQLTTFNEFSIRNSTFFDFVGFEYCTFGEEKNFAKEKIATFSYATFMGFVNFRSTQFLSGLDLQRINLKETPNFLNTKISFENTNRESFRIIKHSFDTVGNFIEANQYFELEMKKYKSEVKSIKDWKNLFLLWLYGATSNYGQSYLRPTIGFLLTATIYGLVLWGYENNFLYSIYEPANQYLNSLFNFINGISKNVIPIKLFLKEGMETISLIAYIFFMSFIWLIILAIKRKTKR